MLYKIVVDLSATNENRLKVVLSNNVIFSGPYDSSQNILWNTDF